MMRRWERLGRVAAFCALAVVGGCSAPHHDAVPESEAARPTDEDFSCKRDEAKLVKFSVLHRHPEQFADRCVLLELFTDGVDFGENASALHAPPQKGDRFLVFHFDETEPQLPKHPSFVSIVARVRACLEGAPKSCLDGVYVSDVRIVPTAMD